MAIALVALIALVWPSVASADLVETASGATSEATGSVERSVNETSGSAARAGEDVQRAVNETTSGNGAVEETTGAVEETTGAVEETTGAVEETTGAVEETTGAVGRETRRAVEETTGVVDETSRAVEETAAAGEQTARAIVETTGVGETTSAVEETAGAVDERTTAVVEQTAAAVETTGAVVETTGAVVEPLTAAGELGSLTPRAGSIDGPTLDLAVGAPERASAGLPGPTAQTLGVAPAPVPTSGLPTTTLVSSAPGTEGSSLGAALPAGRNHAPEPPAPAASTALLAFAASAFAVAIENAGSPAPALPHGPQPPSELPAGSGSAQNLFSFGIFLALAALFTLWLAGWVGRLLPSAVHWRPAPYIALLERPG